MNIKYTTSTDSDNRPIGFFDSGLGGLTCIPYLLGALPNERVVYFGDTARTPYGSKAPSTIRKFAIEIADFLVETQNVKMLAIACNTVSATALEALRERHPHIPVLGVISPAARTVSNTCVPENSIGVIGTRATITSEAYYKKIIGQNPALRVFQQPCPAFVPLIEEGIIENRIMDLTIRHYMDKFLEHNKIDTLVLGCTHYSIIKENIVRLYPGLRIIDPSEEMLRSVTGALENHSLRAGEPGGGHVFYASDLSETFVNMIRLIFSGTGYPVTFKTFDLESFSERRGTRK
jgi:glutamate racemase